MWQLIRINKIKSIILIVMMAICLLGLGLLIGMMAVGPRGALMGMIIASGVWFLLTIVSFSSGDQILLATSKAMPVTHDVHPQLFNIVEEMSIAASLPMPKVYIIPDPAPNAFATGRNPQSASLAVTAGLLGRMNRDELQGVVAHEMSHILHRDILFITLAGIMLGAIVLISQVFLRSMFYGSMGGSRRRYSSDNRGNAQAQIILLVVAIAAAILAPIFAQILYFALSQRREYLADAGAARLTRYPEGLANALEKIANDSSPQIASANKVTAPMYIVNPLKSHKQANLSNLSSTHPPIADRIRILRNMTHGASFKDYSESYRDITHSKTIIPKAALAEKEDISLREVSSKNQQDSEKQKRQIGDLMMLANNFIFLPCTCGLKLKIPPTFKADQIICPRCKRKLQIPSENTK